MLPTAGYTATILIARLVSTRLKDGSFPGLYDVTNFCGVDNQAGSSASTTRQGLNCWALPVRRRTAEALYLASEALRLAGIGEFRLAAGR